MKTTALALVSLLALAFLPGSAGAQAGGEQITLSSTGIIPNAAGSATIVRSGNKAGIAVAVSNLPPATVFLVKVDGRLAGALNTDDAGADELVLAVSPKGGKGRLPSSVSPATAILVEVVNESGAVVLVGAF